MRWHSRGPSLGVSLRPKQHSGRKVPHRSGSDGRWVAPVIGVSGWGGPPRYSSWFSRGWSLLIPWRSRVPVQLVGCRPCVLFCHNAIQPGASFAGAHFPVANSVLRPARRVVCLFCSLGLVQSVPQQLRFCASFQLQAGLQRVGMWFCRMCTCCLAYRLPNGAYRPGLP